MRRLRTTLVALSLLATSPLVTSCGGHEPAAEAEETSGERLTIALSSAPDIKPVSAVVAPRDMGEARARISGVLTQLLVREGDWVSEGQTIGLIVDDRIGLQTAALGALVASAEAESARTRADLSRIQTLFDQGIYAQARLDQARAAADGAEGQARAARAQRAATAELGVQGRILAPSSGRVLTADVPEGSYVAAGEPVATVTAGPLVLRIEVPEAQGGALRLGQTVQITEGGGSGVVAQIYPAATAGLVAADLSAPGLEQLGVGRRVVVELPLGEREMIAIPRRFVSTRFGVDYVRTLGAGDATVEAPVQLGQTLVDGRVEVLSGLSVGDVVLASETP